MGTLQVQSQSQPRSTRFLPQTEPENFNPYPRKKAQKPSGSGRLGAGRLGLVGSGGFCPPLAGATPCPKNGVVRPPHFLAKGWPATPYRPYGGFLAKATLRPLGVVRPPRKAKKKKREKWVWDCGGGRTTPKGLGVASATTYGRRGWPKPPPGPWGWSGHPQNPKPIFPFFFFFLVAEPPPKAWGGFGHPHTGRMGVAEATPISLFFIFYFLLFPSFFQKKKIKIKPKMPKTMSFWAKRRSFG
jgi:hypothetical protein